MTMSPTRPMVALGLCLAVAAGSLLPAGAGATAQRPHAQKIPVRCKSYLTPKSTIKFSDWEFPDTLNVAQSSLLVTAYVDNAIFDGLWVYDQHGRFTPQMATRVPTVKNGGIKDGGRTIVINLKKGLLWSNGSEITSQDIQFGLAVGKNPASGPYCQGSCDVISRIDTPNRYTAVLHLSRIYSPVLAYGLPPIFPHKWSSSSGSWNNNAAQAAKLNYQVSTYNYEDASYPTNGAYRVQQFSKDDRIVLTPFKRYNDMTCGAYLKSLIFAFYSSKEGMIAGAANGETDVTGGGGGYTPADLVELRKHTGAYKLYETPSFSFEQLGFNIDPTYNGKPNPVANVKVRQALALALNKVGLIQSALGINAAAARSIEAWTPLVITSKLVQAFADKKVNGQWDSIARKYVAGTGSGTALQHAKTLLAQTQYKSGFDLDFQTTSGNPVRSAQAAVIENNWKALGVNVKITYVPAGTFFSQYSQGGPLHRGAFQVGMFGSSGSPDPDQLKYNAETRYIDRRQSVHTPLNQNYSGIHDSAIDKAFDRAAGTANNKERARNYAIIQEQLNKQAYWVMLYYRPTIATQSPEVHGFLNNPTQAGPSWNIYKWRAAE